MMHKFLVSVLLILLAYSFQAKALVGAGGYVPFGMATQKDPDGGDNKFTLNPMFTLNTVFPLPYNHVALPEFGVVFHRDTYDDVTKRTIFVLWDVGYRLTPEFLLRYGLGTFLTRIGGDGGTTELPNGDSTLTFAQPNESTTSWNTTINLGADFAVDAHYTIKFETFIFGMLDSDKRELSYALSINYY